MKKADASCSCLRYMYFTYIEQSYALLYDRLWPTKVLALMWTSGTTSSGTVTTWDCSVNLITGVFG